MCKLRQRLIEKMNILDIVIGHANIQNKAQKKIPVVSVSYREKIRVGRSEIYIFFHGFFNN
jgi:hypothetical protein